jgi:hypothetical protein
MCGYNLGGHDDHAYDACQSENDGDGDHEDDHDDDVRRVFSLSYKSHFFWLVLSLIEE